MGSNRGGGLCVAAESVVRQRSLGDLVEVIATEHQAVGRVLASALPHAIRAGDALWEARARVGGADWHTWLTESFPFSRRAANVYMRISKYQDRLGPDMSIGQARRFLEGEPRADRRMDASEIEEARALRQAGMGLKVIAKQMGVSYGGIRYHLDPCEVERSRAKSTRKRAVRQAEAALLPHAVECHGQPVGPSQLAVKVRAVTEARSAGDREALKGALRDLAAAAMAWHDGLER